MLNTNNEIWKAVPGYEGLYEVSNFGNIRNNRKLLKFYTINSGYLCLKLIKDGVRISPLVHRIVASVFCQKLDNYTEVNHIDGNKQNNHYTNLEWCSSSENKQHALSKGLYNAIYLTKNSLGRKHLPNTYSKYHNVTFDKRRGKWASTIRINGKNMFSKRFNTEEEAAIHVNWIIDYLSLTDRPKNIIS